MTEEEFRERIRAELYAIGFCAILQLALTTVLIIELKFILDALT